MNKVLILILLCSKGFRSLASRWKISINRIIIVYTFLIVFLFNGFLGFAQHNEQKVLSKTITPSSIFTWKSSQKYGFEMDRGAFMSAHGNPTNSDKVEVKVFVTWATNTTSALVPISGKINTYEYQDGMLYGAKASMQDADGPFVTRDDYWISESTSCNDEAFLLGCWGQYLRADKSNEFENFIMAYIKDQNGRFNLLNLSLNVNIVLTTYGNVELEHIERVVLPGMTLSKNEIMNNGKSALYTSSYFSAPDREFIFGEVRDAGKPLDPTSWKSTALKQSNVGHQVPDPNNGWNWTNYNFIEYEATYYHGQPEVSFFINQNSWPNSTDSRKVANQYAKALGRVPEVLRDLSLNPGAKNIEIAVMYDFSNSWSVKPEPVPETNGKTFQILIDHKWTETFGQMGKLNEEVFMHELSHILHEQVNSGYNSEWSTAVSNDDYWISDYAFDARYSQTPEDHSETFPVWLMYKYKSDRLFKWLFIGQALTNRFQYYDNNFSCKRIRPWSLTPRGDGPGCNGELRTAGESIADRSMSEEEGQLREFVVYPNPSNRVFNIRMNVDTDGEGLCKVFDLSGKKLLEYPLTLNKGNTHLQINKDGRLKSGIYLIEISGPDIIERRRVILE